MAASGRYKSRLLNYLVEQSQKLGEQAGHRLRQARTGVVWGAQILLYPLYVAFQSSRVVGRRLSQGGPMPGRQARLSPPRADDVISSVLKLARNLADEGAITISTDQSQVEQSQLQTVGVIAGKIPAPATQQPEISLDDLSNPVSSAGSSINVALAPNPTKASLKSASPDGANIVLGGVDIRAVASELGNRALVLVDNSNRIVPLESEQQWSLQQTIVQQVADFNYRRKRYSQQLALVEAGNSEGNLLRDRPLPLPQPRTKQFAGVRWMAHLMGWMQTGNLAQSTNLFQESQLANQLAAQVAAPPFLYWDPEPGQRLTRETLAQLDSPLAGLEQRYIHRDERDDAATKALRFTAKLFGLEEAADQWLRASAASKAAENSNVPQNTSELLPGLRPNQMPDSQTPGSQMPDNPISGGQVAGSQIPGTIHPSWTSADPWGDYKGQLQGNAPQGFEPSQLLADDSSSQNHLPLAIAQPQLKKPQGWFSSFLNPSSAAATGPEAPTVTPQSPGDSSPKGWQRLTTRFGGLLRNLQQPAGPIAPLKPQAPKPSTPAAPTNANIGLGQDARNGNAPQDNLAQAGLSDPQIEAAWQKRVANAKSKAGGLKSENVTLRSQPEGAQSLAAVSGEQAQENPAESTDPNALQTAENSVTYESPYIETTARFNGYERHPLEVVLDQVDRILLWIEELGLRLWRWLTNSGEQ